jgi:hypothetical protein
MASLIAAGPHRSCEANPSRRDRGGSVCGALIVGLVVAHGCVE